MRYGRDADGDSSAPAGARCPARSGQRGPDSVIAGLARETAALWRGKPTPFRLSAGLRRTVRFIRRSRTHKSRYPATPGQEAPSEQPAALRILKGLEHPPANVVLVLGRDAVRAANAVARQTPTATVHLLAVRRLDERKRARLRTNVVYRHCATIGARIDYLSRCPQPDAIIESGNRLRRQRLSCFEQLFPFVTPGGVYVVESIGSRHRSEADTPPRWGIRDLVTTIDALHGGAPREGVRGATLRLADSAGRVEIDDGACRVTKRSADQFKLRDRDANALLQARFGDRWGAVVDTRAAVGFESRATVVSHRDGRPGDGGGTFPEQAQARDHRYTATRTEVPDRFLRRYENVQCWPLQRLRYGDYWLPDTFRHHRHQFLSNRGLLAAGSQLARLKQGAAGPTRHATGPFFYFDTEYPGHFGHVMTEVVSRYWGWLAARELAPEIRPLISLSAGQKRVPGFQRAVFAALGVDLDTTEYVRPDECLAVDTLYAATPDFVMPHYVAPELAPVWDTIGRGCARQDASELPERLFVSRRPRRLRTCVNWDQVEAMFARNGFTVIYPQDHDFGTQVSMFQQARVIAGFAGSGMVNSMFAPGARIILVSGDSYNAVNEQMIRSVVGGELHYFWGDSQIKHPAGGWTWAAYQSNFVFDVARFEDEIAAVADGTW